MTTPLYPIIEKIVSDEWIKLDREKITPWVFMTAGAPFQIEDYYGKKILYQGIEFEGGARDVFWNRYIEPFIERVIDFIVNESLRLSEERNQNPKLMLLEAGCLLKSLVQKVYLRMIEIDRQLRGKGHPHSVPVKNVDGKISAMEQFINRRIDAEVSMVKTKLKVNEIYNKYPFIFWVIPLVISIAS